MRELARQLATPQRSLAGGFREYEAHLRFERRLSPASRQHAQRTLHAFLGGTTDDPIASLTPEHAHKLARFEHSQSQGLGHAFRFFDWAKFHRYVELN